MLYLLIHEEDEWGNLDRRTKNKYRNILKDASEIDLTDLIKLTLKESEKQLQKQIDFWLL